MMEFILFSGSSQSYVLTLLWPAVISLVLIWLVKYWVAGRKFAHLSHIPGPGDWPLVGSVPFVNRTPTGFYEQMLKLSDRFRDVEMFAFRLGNQYNIQLFTANKVEQLLKSYDFLDKAERYDFLHNWLGAGLLTSTGEKWRSRRRMLTPSFHFNILKDALEAMNNHAASFRDLLLQEVSDKQKDAEIDIFRLLTLVSLDIIGETAMGVQMDALHNEGSEYVKAVLFTKDSISQRMRTPWLFPRVIFENTSLGHAVKRSTGLMHQYAFKVIRERRAAMSGSNEESHRNQAFLDTLLNCRDVDGSPLSDEDIREEVDTFMFEGHDTVSSALGFTTYVLGKHPDEQEKCHQDLLDVVGSSKHFTMDDLSKMTYLEWCIKESMRLYPPVPFIGRAVSADIELAGHRIPKGAGSLGVVISGLHRDPAVFPEPEKFDPTRFSPEKSANRHPYAYVPFSAGPRNCIGQRFAMMELKVVMATLLLTFKIESVQKESELDLNPGLVLQPGNGILVKLSTRL